MDSNSDLLMNQKDTSCILVNTECITANSEKKKKNKKKKRKCEKYPEKYCMVCDKKLKITSTKCRCGYKYCNLHRLPEDHSCNFDYKIMDHKLYEKTHGLGGGAFDKVLKI
jgi:hypothetical protein